MLNRLYTPQEKFYTQPEALFYKIKDKKAQIGRIIKKVLKWVFIVGIILLFVFSIITTIISLQKQPTVKSALELGDGMNIFYKIVMGFLWPLNTILWIIIWTFGFAVYGAQQLFENVGGGWVINSISTNPNFASYIGIFSGCFIFLFLIFLIIRAIKISQKKDSLEAGVMAKTTPGIVFWCIGVMVVMPVIAITLTTLLLVLLNAAQTALSGGAGGNDIALSLFKGCCNAVGDNTPQINWGNWADKFPNLKGPLTFMDVFKSPMNPPGGNLLVDPKQYAKLPTDNDVEFNFFLCSILWIVGVIACGKFCWKSIQSFLNIIICHICLFPAVAKWPADEGGSAEAIKTEMVSNWIYIFALYLLWILANILLSSLDNIPIGGFNRFLQGGLTKGVLLLAIIFTCGKFSQKAPDFFLASRKAEVLDTIPGLSSGISATGKTMSKGAKKGHAASQALSDRRRVAKGNKLLKQRQAAIDEATKAAKANNLKGRKISSEAGKAAKAFDAQTTKKQKAAIEFAKKNNGEKPKFFETYKKYLKKNKN